MIGRRSAKVLETQDDSRLSFDDYELRLGDMMRGERATMGKSLLDVQRELRIKASYIAAIENCDPDVFDTPGFIAGYVRSYARYLNMNPDRAFDAFCKESGFEVAHGMAAEASVVNKLPTKGKQTALRDTNDIFASSATPYIPSADAMLSRVEPGAISSMMVLLALIGAIGYGGWTVLNEIQRVQVVPVEQTPVVLSDISPLSGTAQQAQTAAAPTLNGTSDLTIGAAPSQQAQQTAALDRLYRPQALEVPVLTSRDAPIATLDPTASGAFADAMPVIDQTVLPAQSEILALVQAAEEQAVATEAQARAVPQVVEDVNPTIRMVAADASWVRVRSAEGNTLFEATMQAGDTYDIPAMEVAPTLRTGNSGAIYFAMGADCYGPVGASGRVTSNLALDRTKLAEVIAPVNPDDANDALNRMFANASSLDVAVPAKLPCQTD